MRWRRYDYGVITFQLSDLRYCSQSYLQACREISRLVMALDICTALYHTGSVSAMEDADMKLVGDVVAHSFNMSYANKWLTVRRDIDMTVSWEFSVVFVRPVLFEVCNESSYHTASTMFTYIFFFSDILREHPWKQMHICFILKQKTDMTSENYPSVGLKAGPQTWSVDKYCSQSTWSGLWWCIPNITNPIAFSIYAHDFKMLYAFINSWFYGIVKFCVYVHVCFSIANIWFMPSDLLSCNVVTCTMPVTNRMCLTLRCIYPAYFKRIVL